MPEPAVGLMVGTFDLFHVGHLDAVLLAAAGVDRLIVGVAGDDLAEEITGRRPFVPEIERVQIVGAVRCVADVVPLGAAGVAELAGTVAATGATALFVPGADEVAERLAGGLEAAGTDVRVTRLPVDRTTVSSTLHAALGEGAGGAGRSSVA